MKAYFFKENRAGDYRLTDGSLDGEISDSVKVGSKIVIDSRPVEVIDIFYCIDNKAIIIYKY